MNLIKEKESKELYSIQQKILSRLEEETTADDVIRLALLQATPPIDDFESTMEVLDYYKDRVSDIRIYILGVYYANAWTYEKEYSFVADLEKQVDNYDDRTKSIIYYVLALNEFQTQGERKKIVDYLEKSIDLCGEYVSNLLLYSTYLLREEREPYISKAKENVEKIETEEEMHEYPEGQFDEPQYFWKSEIEQVYMDEYSYRENFPKKGKVRWEDVYFYKNTILGVRKK